MSQIATRESVSARASPGTADAAFERLGRAFDGPRLGYHAFRIHGRRLVYDLARGAILEPSPAAFALLAGIEEGLRGSALGLRVRSAAPDVDPERLAAEVEALRAHGFLRAEGLDSPEARARVLAGLDAHHPNKLMLLVQTACNLRCAYCYEVKAGFHSTGKGMDLETAKRSVEHLIARSGPRRELEITFFGGEPLLSFDRVREVVAWCRERGAECGKSFHFQMTTNAVLMNADVIDFLVAERFTVMVSLDGPPESADQNRVDHGGRGVTAKALANAKRLIARQKAAGLRPATIRATLAKGNSSMLAAGDFLGGEGFERVMIGASFGRAHEKHAVDLGPEDLGRLEGEADVELDRFLAWIDGRGSKPPTDAIERSLRGLAQALENPRPFAQVGCGVGRNMQAITADGTIYPCHRYAGERVWAIGSLDRGIDRDKLSAYYSAILGNYDRHCSSCWARQLCGGQCPWYLSTAAGAVGTPDEPSCDSIRGGLERQLFALLAVRERQRRGHVPAARLDEMSAAEFASTPLTTNQETT